MSSNKKQKPPPKREPETGDGPGQAQEEGAEASLTIDDLDPDFPREVMSHEEARGLNHCYACASCTAGCPVHEVFPEFDPRKLALMVKLGLRTAVLSSPHLWACTACHSCEEHCPQNVQLYHILNVLKNMAAREGHTPYPWIIQTRNLARTGVIYRTDESLREKRRARSLPELACEGEKARAVIEASDLGRRVERRRRR